MLWVSEERLLLVERKAGVFVVREALCAVRASSLFFLLLLC